MKLLFMAQGKVIGSIPLTHDELRMTLDNWGTVSRMARLEAELPEVAVREGNGLRVIGRLKKEEE